MRTIFTTTTTTTTSTTTLAPMATITYSPIATTTTTHSPWHSPIPYLFGGLAAMLGLIAFALLMLACSYWRLSSQNQTQNQEGDNNIGDLENKEGENEKNEPFKTYEEKILVIMAGDQKPTFLATPVCHVYGKHDLGKDFCDMEIGKSDECFNVSDEKEALDKDNNNHVVVHVATIASTTTQENNEGSQEQQQNQ